jgi:hypothetical protein
LKDDEAQDERRDVDRFRPCPRCGAREVFPVTWTWWGSFLGPKICSLVSCPGCEHTYNGRTGGSNVFTMVAFVTVPLLGIAGILVGLFFILKSKGAI